MLSDEPNVQSLDMEGRKAGGWWIYHEGSKIGRMELKESEMYIYGTEGKLKETVEWNPFVEIKKFITDELPGMINETE